MKPSLLALLVLLVPVTNRANPTIDPGHSLAWGANVGWIDWRGSVTSGVVTGEYVCSGYLWTANSGWISLGTGSPADGIRYTNTSGADFGVNVSPDGTLRGLAWGANIGWVNFEITGNPRINLATGRLTGYAWGANVGWVTLDDGADHFLATTAIAAGADTDGDGITDAWELEHAGKLSILNATGDADNDGFSDLAEYRADTDPLQSTTTVFGSVTSPNTIELTWTSRLARRYYIETSTDLVSGKWVDSGKGEIAPDSDVTTTRVLIRPDIARSFYRIRVSRPLAQ